MYSNLPPGQYRNKEKQTLTIAGRPSPGVLLTEILPASRTIMVTFDLDVANQTVDVTLKDDNVADGTCCLTV